MDEIGNTQDLLNLLESRGLSVIVLKQSECNIESGAIVAYHKKALGSLLKSRRRVLCRSGWPDDPDRFARYHMLHDAPFKTALYDLVADAYGDFENPFRSDSRRPIRPVLGGLARFGALRLCCSHLL